MTAATSCEKLEFAVPVVDSCCFSNVGVDDASPSRSAREWGDPDAAPEAGYANFIR